MILAVLVLEYPLAVALRDRPNLQRSPLLLVDHHRRVLGVTAAAAALGASAGQTLTQAQACVPEALVLADDPDRRERQWKQILDALDTLSPLVEDAGEGTAFAEIRDEGRSAFLRARAALAATNLRYRLGAATNRWVARAAALLEDGHLSPAGEEAALVAPLPVALLPGLDARTAERLTFLGLRTLGDLAALPHGPFVRRFGARATRWHALARGIDDALLVPRPRPLRIGRARGDFGDGGIEREEQLILALRELVARIAEDLALAGRRCGRLSLVLELENGLEERLLVGIAEPTAEAAMLLALVRTRLEGHRLAAPVISLRLRAEALHRAEDSVSPLTLFAAQATPSVAPALRAEIRLIAPPRVVSVILRRDGAPELVDGRRVLAYGGPWRRDEAWWRIPGHVVRDEYDVWLAGGLLWRLASAPIGTRSEASFHLIGVYG